jgi:type II secretory pathway component PulJ
MVTKASGFVLLDVMISLGVLSILLGIGGQCMLELKRMDHDLLVIENETLRSMNQVQKDLHDNQQLPTGNITLCRYRLGAFESVYVCKK